MTVTTTALSHRLRPLMAAVCLSASLGAGFSAAAILTSAPAMARGPDGIADVAEKVIDAVVNISTSQTVEAKAGAKADRGHQRAQAKAQGWGRNGHIGSLFSKMG